MAKKPKFWAPAGKEAAKDKKPGEKPATPSGEKKPARRLRDAYDRKKD